MRNVYWMTTDIMDTMTEQQELARIEELDSITETVETVREEMNRKLKLAHEYGYSEYADELVILLSKLDRFRKG